MRQQRREPFWLDESGLRPAPAIFIVAFAILGMIAYFWGIV